MNLRKNIEERAFFLTILTVCAYILFFVPQIRNVWQQLPPLGWWLGAYAAFLLPLLCFYTGSLLVVLDSRVWRWLRRANPPHPWYVRALWWSFCALPELAAGWLARVCKWSVLSRPWAGAFVVICGVVALGAGPVSDASVGYPLIGAFCRGLGMILAGIGVWVLSNVSVAPAGTPRSLRHTLILIAMSVLVACAGAGVGWGLRDTLAPSFCLGASLTLVGTILFAILDGWEPQAGLNRKRGFALMALGLVIAGFPWLLSFGLFRFVDEGWRPYLDRMAGPGAVLLGIGLSLFVPRPAARAADPDPGDGGLHSGPWYVGRLLSWLLLTAIAGEILWALAYTDDWGNVVSYRLYTIWAVLQALVFLALMGRLIDRLWAVYKNRPVRQIALGVVLVAFGMMTSWEALSENEVERHLTRGRLAAVREATKRAAANRQQAAHERGEQWLGQFITRVGSVPVGEGPVVLIAASGGGSRAAIFTALTLEALARTPIDPQASAYGDPNLEKVSRTWADNVVLISSVSGGSLAAAHYVHRLEPIPGTQPPLVRLRDSAPVAELRNTTASELVSYLAELSAGELDDYPRKLLERAKKSDFERSLDDHLRGLLDPQPPAPPAPPGKPAVGRDALRAKLDALLRGRNALLRPSRGQATATLGAGTAGLAGGGGGPFLAAALACSGSDASPVAWPALPEDLDYAMTPETKSDTAKLDVLTQLIARLRCDALAASAAGRAPAGGDAGGKWPAAAGFPKEWVFHSKAFDEMCLDFMAPLMRGMLSPTLGRGDALARFWTHHFKWYDSTNCDGYGDGGRTGVPAYRHHHPVILFNTCDVANGSRIVIGFPPLPDDLWQFGSDDRNATRTKPRPLNELSPDFRVSLARAVRLSSNFPFGFRVSGLEIYDKDAADGPRRWVHMLDGGVIDNTGIDTIFELFSALEWQAANHPAEERRRQCGRVLEALRLRGVVVLEIDAGAKPAETTPSRFDLLGGTREPLQALSNAAYTNADIVKDYYVSRIRGILNPNLNRLNALGREAAERVASYQPSLPSTVVRVVFQCNHYLPGQEVQDPEVMTAWSLGPMDKAQVLQRFLIELEGWDQTRRDVALYLRNSSRASVPIQRRAQKEALLAAMQALHGSYEELDWTPFATRNTAAVKEKRQELHRQMKRITEEYFRAPADTNLTAAWRALLDRSQWTDEVKPISVQAVANTVRSAVSRAQIKDARQKAATGQAPRPEAAAKVRDPQWKLDLKADRANSMQKSR
jgi:hypothetical protein